MNLPSHPQGTAGLFVLGSLHVFDAAGEGVAALEAQPKRAALLIYLACQPREGFCPRDHLLTLFWPDFDDERARNSLRTSLYYVRRAIGPGIVNSRSDGALEADARSLWCDVRAFEAAVAEQRWSDATDLYRGDFLEGSAVSASVEFDQWVEAYRRKLRRQCAEALFRISESKERACDLEGALDALGRARTLLPADEAILRRSLTLWGRSGNRVRAIQEYEVFAQTLESLYELEPSPETREILRRVSDGRLAPAGDSRGEMGDPSGAPAADGPNQDPPHSDDETDGAAEAEVGSGPAAPSRPAAAPWRLGSGAGRVARLVAFGFLLAGAFTLGRIDAKPAAPGGGLTPVVVLPLEDVTAGARRMDSAPDLVHLLTEEMYRLGWEVLQPRSLEGAPADYESQVAFARALGAGRVVTGRIVQDGDGILVLAALAPTETPHLTEGWVRIRGKRTDLPALAAAVARGLARAD